MKDELYIELCGHQINKSDLLKKAKELWTNNGNKIKDLKTLDMYYKPDEKKCYCVFNGNADNLSFDV